MRWAHCGLIEPHCGPVEPHCGKVEPHWDRITPHWETITPHCDRITPHWDTFHYKDYCFNHSKNKNAPVLLRQPLFNFLNRYLQPQKL